MTGVTVPSVGDSPAFAAGDAVCSVGTPRIKAWFGEHPQVIAASGTDFTYGLVLVHVQ